MFGWNKLGLAVALAGATVAFADGAMAAPYAAGFGTGSNFGSSYTGDSYGGGRVGSSRRYYRSGRYSGPYRTDSAPLSGGGY